MDDQDIQLIVVLTETGQIATMTAKYRPQVKIIAASVNAHVVRQMNAVRGVTGMKIPTFLGQDNLIKNILDEAKKLDHCRDGDKVAVVHGVKEGSPDQFNLLKIVRA